MDYDRGQGSYEMARPLYTGRPAGSGGTGAGAGAPYYPRVGTMTRAPPPPVPSSSFPSGSAGSAIKVAMKPQYRVGPPAQLRGQSREVPRSLFQFEFDLERRIIAEAESNPHHQVRLAGPSGTSAAPAQASNGGDNNNLAQVEDATVAKYLAMGHNKESIQYALQTYGDDQTKILDFCPSYNRMREMGFSGDRIARALASFDNDVDTAIQSLVGAL